MELKTIAMKRLSKTTFHSHRRLSVKKRTIIIIASSLLALGIATYVVLSIRAWDAQDAVAIQSRDQLKENITSAAKKQVIIRTAKPPLEDKIQQLSNYSLTLFPH